MTETIYLGGSIRLTIGKERDLSISKILSSIQQSVLKTLINGKWESVIATIKDTKLEDFFVDVLQSLRIIY